MTWSRESNHGDGGEWTLPAPPELSPDMVTVQTIRLSRVPRANLSAKDARYYSARINYRLGRSYTSIMFTLYTNSVFIAAPLCWGSHKIDPRAAGHYTFMVQGIEELARISKKGDAAARMVILIINSTGGPASKVFACVWCCHTGTNAMIWRLEGDKCCFKCVLMVASTDDLGAGVLIACQTFASLYSQ
ncbi:uncharacterized protein P174DRAFT_25 [Aspergillus novofumigatus IBT 16806]|uniref:Uncharacterized protein n=1 Tax=Aspergillus novofumigatus (strain IBT 16806) TaxID=1392255 RepID=A0A2I1CJR5_ASPN1|nr:uncharacterized protein P174DRAFT_25 [Aspergillus novofumigatus IBT 16806]PKX97862.1 hypothetical protein P174DRAFT_25 [Aspergillus novofumigatus IBT 16806]